MYEPVLCKVVCVKDYGPKEVAQFVEKIEEKYFVNWIVDNLPAAFKTISEDQTQQLSYYSHGFPLGGTVINDDTPPVSKFFIHNHVTISLHYHVPAFELKDGDAAGSFSSDELPGRIVRLFAEPFSVKHKLNKEKTEVRSGCNFETEAQEVVRYGQILDADGTEVAWTYSVEWVQSDVKWASRWDVYLSSKNKSSDEVHWFSIINSLLIVVFLTGMVAMIMMRTLHRDLSRYNRVPTEEEKAEEREETGWKLVHGDVLRPPAMPMLFAVTIGTGVQVLGMAIFTILFAAVGFLSPAYRGSLMVALLLLFMFMGIGAGYSSARTYKQFNGDQWQRCTLLTALLYPGVICACIFALNLVVWAEGSSSAIPFGSMVAVLALWFCISVPLTFLGAFYGYKKDLDKAAVQTQDIPRAIPEQPWYMSGYLTVLVGGILPFGAVFVELFFILSSIWLDQYYYVFGFLLLVFAILMITCAEITIVLCYFQLCGEDYHWWWRSVFTSGSSALYLFLYVPPLVLGALSLRGCCLRSAHLTSPLLPSFLPFLLIFFFPPGTRSSTFRSASTWICWPQRASTSDTCSSSPCSSSSRPDASGTFLASGSSTRSSPASRSPRNSNNTYLSTHQQSNELHSPFLMPSAVSFRFLENFKGWQVHPTSCFEPVTWAVGEV